MATIHERKTKSGETRYTVEIRITGHPPVSKTFRRKTDARNWIKTTEAAINDGQFLGDGKDRKRTVRAVLDRYLTEVLPTKRSDHKDVRRHLEWWKERLGSCRLSNLKPAMIAKLRDELLQGTYKKGEREYPRQPGTVGRYLASLSVAFSYAVKDWAWMSSNPVLNVRKPSEPRGRVRYLLEHEKKPLLLACQNISNPYLYPIVVLALSTGARWGELIGLRWEDIDFERRMMTLHETKNDERRSTPLSELAITLLRNLDERSEKVDAEFIFARSDGKRPMEIRKYWNQALKNAGLTDFRFHDLRHTCASYLAMSGASLPEIGAVLGHKTHAMSQRYSHIAEQHTAQLLESMTSRFFGNLDTSEAEETASDEKNKPRTESDQNG